MPDLRPDHVTPVCLIDMLSTPRTPMYWGPSRFCYFKQGQDTVFHPMECNETVYTITETYGSNLQCYQTSTNFTGGGFVLVLHT